MILERCLLTTVGDELKRLTYDSDGNVIENAESITGVNSFVQ